MEESSKIRGVWGQSEKLGRKQQEGMQITEWDLTGVRGRIQKRKQDRKVEQNKQNSEKKERENRVIEQERG